jgi:hypothetical protein
MVAGGDRGTGEGSAPQGERFEIERFEWVAPDRVAVSGTFRDLRDVPGLEPALVVRGPAGARRLASVPDSIAGPPQEGRSWGATFTWHDTPIAFESAELTFGDEVVVPLGRPYADDASGEARMVGVRRARVRPDGAGASAATATVQQLRLEAELLAAQEQIRELRETAERASGELARARSELTAERARRAAEADQFRKDLARIRDSAERAVGEFQAGAETQAADLRDAQEALQRKDRELEGRRAELEAARTERERLDHEVQRLELRNADTQDMRARALEASQDARRLLERLTEMAGAQDADGGDAGR